jgi:polyhydroxyalkanoate synthase
MMEKLLKRVKNLVSIPGKQPVVGATPADVVHEENKWRLLRYRPRAQGFAYATPVLMVPSLINRHYVLDLMPNKSLAEYLVARGHDLYVLDWGTPGNEDRYLTFDDVCDRALARALRVASQHSGSDGVHLFGYCLGGTLAVIHAAARPERIHTLLALAAPVRFDDGGLLSRWAQSPAFNPEAVVDAFGNVPWQLLQSSFQLLRPTLPLSKGVHLLDRAWDDEYLDGFLALEKWGADNVAFPGRCWAEYLEKLYRRNELHAGTLRLSGAPARMESIACPVLAVVFEHDNIVPKASASELIDRVASADKDLWTLPGGHVGAVVSRAAAKGLWPQLSAWWAVRD